MTKNKTQKTQTPKIAKTVKLYIGGEFPRTESGRTFPIYTHKNKALYAHVCQASRKDFRNAVQSAKAAQPGWQSRSAYNRAQILYRMAEMTESKRHEFTEILTETLGLTSALADTAVSESIASLVYYAGFADKYQQVMGTINPVSGPHHNFTTAEPVGTVALLCSETFHLTDLVTEIAAIICSGNSVVALLSEAGSALITPLSEVMATSDLPKGVVNLLTGKMNELYKQFGTHMEVDSVIYLGRNENVLSELKSDAAENMKRVVTTKAKTKSLEKILNYVEYKTVWHPIGH